MNKILFAFELKTWLLRPSTVIILVIWTLALVYSVGSGSTKVQSQEVRAASLLNNDRLRHQEVMARMDSFARGLLTAKLYWEDERNVFDLGNYRGSRTLVKQPLPLAAINPGQTTIFPSDNPVTTNKAYWFMVLRNAERLDNPANQLFGQFDLAFSLIWLFPLVIIALNFTILSSEKEQGTLPLLLAQGITLSHFLRRKLFFRYMVSTLFTLVAVFASLFLFGNRIWLDGFGVVAVSIGILLYSALWHMATLAVNYLGKSSNYNIGLLFTIWLGVVIVVPVLLNVFLNTLYPLPGRMELLNETRERFTEFDQHNSAILTQYYAEHPEITAKDSSKIMPLFMYRLAIREMRTAEAMYPVISHYKQQLRQQAQRINYTSLINPAMLLQASLEEISGHSTDQFLDFQHAADEENKKWREHFFPLSMDSQLMDVPAFKQLPYPSYKTQMNPIKVIGLITGLALWIGIALRYCLINEQRFCLYR